MTKARVRAIALLCALSAGALAPLQARAHSPANDAFPERPLRVIVPFTAGGGSDYTARLIGTRLAARIGQPVIIDNRPGASGIVGTDLVAKAAPDGYTMLLAFSTHAQGARLFVNLPYDPIRDFAPITQLFAAPLILLLHPAQPAKTLREFIAYAKDRPGQLNYGSSGAGSSPHLMMELLSSMAGMHMTHVPYKGVAAIMPALLGGEIQIAFANPMNAVPLWKVGKLRALAITARRRTAAFPEIPTIAEAGVPRFEALIWYGYLAPARTPRAIVDRLYREISTVLNIPEVRQTLTAQGNLVIASKPDEFASLIDCEAVKWGALGKRLRITMD